MTTSDPSLAAGGGGTTAAGTTPTGTTPAATGTTPNTAATTVTPQTSGDAPPKDDPNWLKPRLERERKAGVKDVLKETGFASIEEAKAAAEAKRSADEANKTNETKAREAQARADQEKARADSLAAIATEHAARMMVGLTAEQQAAVKAIAGDDPAKQLATIGALSPTWAKGTTDAAGGAPNTTAPGAQPGVTTAPAGGAPNGTTPAPTTPRGVYESIRNQNPFAAAAFGASNPQVYNPK